MFSIYRAYSTIVRNSGGGASSRPQLLDILPTKRSLKKILFDVDSRLNYNKYLPVITKIYDNLDSPDLVPVPTYIRGSDLMVFRNVLKEVRTKTHTMNRHLVKLENELIEYSAELGDNNAVTTLAFECLKNPEINTKEDIEHAKKLIKQLVELKHPLTFKMSGDLAYETTNYTKCEQFYQDFLKVECDTMLAGEVYQNLGVLYFQKMKNLNKAEQCFQKAIKLTTIDKLSHSYFHLGLIYEDDPKLARYYFEMAASQGLVESFANLGFLELNVFHDAKKALEWFKLGVELNDFNSIIGVFDCHMSLQNFNNAKSVYENIVKFIETSLSSSPITIEQFHDIRGKSIEKLNSQSKEMTNIQSTTTGSGSSSKSKWDF